MYAIAFAIVCTAALGCFTASPNEDLADRWILGATKEECEKRNAAVVRRIIRDAGDRILRAKVECKAVGV